MVIDSAFYFSVVLSISNILHLGFLIIFSTAMRGNVSTLPQVVVMPVVKTIIAKNYNIIVNYNNLYDG